MKQPLLFNYCDQKQQIFNNVKSEVNCATSLITARSSVKLARYGESDAGGVARPGT
ncbi:TPA: hypothetical protein ACYZE8_003523 [Salmonella enterica]